MIVQHNTPEMLRTFIAVKVSQNKQLTNLLASIQNVLSHMPVKWVSPDNYHITLCFLGSTSVNQVEAITQAIQDTANRYEPFNLSLAGFGYFGSADTPKVLWAGIEPNKTLGLLATDMGALARAAGFSLDEKPFSPHLTLARPKGSGYANTMSKLKKEFGEIPLGNYGITKIYLYQSILGKGGPIYKPISEIALKQG